MVTVNRMGDSICGSLNNEQFGIPYKEEVYNAMLDIEKKMSSVETMDEMKELVEEFKELLVVDLNDVVESKCPNLYYNQAKGTYHLKTGSIVSSIAMPQVLVDRILDSIDKGIDVEPLVKMWTRWLRNPILRGKMKDGLGDRFSEKMFNYINAKYTNYENVEKFMEKDGISRDLAIERATTYQVGITVEGLLRTFKVSNELFDKFELDEDGEVIRKDRREKEVDPDTGLVTYKEQSNEERLFEPAMMGKSGDEFYCGEKLGHIIKVGQVHRLPDWSKVNTDDDSVCVPGLHCGGLDYIRGYQSAGSETHNILVDPMNVGAVPCDDRGAIRVLEYFVLDAFSGVNGAIYHSSKYAAQTDGAWEEQRKEIIEKLGELKEDLSEDKEEIEAL